MVERARQNAKLTSMRQLERWSLLGGILIWTGVLIFGIALLVMLRNQRDERLAYASLPTETPTSAATPTPSPAPTETPQRYPAGWSTATPTPIGPSPLRRRKATRQHIQLRAEPGDHGLHVIRRAYAGSR